MEFVDLLFFPFHWLMDIWWVRILASLAYILFMFIFMPLMLLGLAWAMFKSFTAYLFSLRYTRSLVVVLSCIASMWYLYVMCLA